MSVVALMWFLVCLEGAGTHIQWPRIFGTAVKSLVAKWRFTGKKPQTVRYVTFQLSAALGESFREMWLFSLVYLSMSSYTRRWGWSLSVSELRTGRKVRKCRILTICADLSISMYLSITWPSCNVSGRIDLNFGLLLERWYLHAVTQKIWHCCE